MSRERGTCRRCAFFQSNDCRRFPPVADPAGGCGRWPQVIEQSWCGEFRRVGDVPRSIGGPISPAKAAGGHARAAKMTAGQRSAHASKAANARWRIPPAGGEEGDTEPRDRFDRTMGPHKLPT